MADNQPRAAWDLADMQETMPDGTPVGKHILLNSGSRALDCSFEMNDIDTLSRCYTYINSKLGSFS